MRVCIDPGHSDPAETGAVYSGQTAASLVLQIAMHAAVYLAAFGHEVILTRIINAKSILIKQRTAIANESNSDLFVSICVNEITFSRTCGVETYYLSDSASGVVLANSLHAHLIDLGCFLNRGSKPADLSILRAVAMPAALVKCGYLSNPVDRALLLSGAGRKSIGWAIANGVQEYGLLQ